MLRTKEILNEITSLEDSKKKVARELERLKQQVPEGVSLRVARHGGSCQYFMREKGAEKTGKYPLNTREVRKMLKNLRITLGY